MKLDEIRRVSLASLPTALEESTRLGERIGVERLLIKRDDNTGLALGGNKARKLEYLMAAAQDSGADVVLTCGGLQSNHVRMTAAAAHRIGMECVLFIPGERPETYDGNLLIDAILGAELHIIPGISYDDLYAEMEEHSRRLEAQGLRPFIIPMGGSTALASLGYVQGVRELSGQLEELGIREADVVFAVGTGGTMAGITVGTRLFIPGLQPVGISILHPQARAVATVDRIAHEALGLIGKENEVEIPTLEIYDDYIGEGYGLPTPECVDVILLAARTEGIILDPVYTGKAMAGLVDLVERGKIGQGRPVVFWHTGGSPALFAHEEMFHSEACRLCC